VSLHVFILASRQAEKAYIGQLEQTGRQMGELVVSQAEHPQRTHPSLRKKKTSDRR
jgi:hypothetical protein